MTAEMTVEEGKIWLETESIRCGFDWADPESGATDRPGVREIRIRDSQCWPTSQPVPTRGIWLWPEYFMRKGVTTRSGVPTGGLRHEFRDGEVVYCYEPDPEWQIAMESGFRVHGNAIDARYTLTAQCHHPEFELFMASYVDSAFGQTLVQARNVAANDGWTVIDNRRDLWGVWMVFADGAAATRFFDGRWEFIRDHELEHSFAALYTLERPIMVAYSVLTGAAAVFLSDPRETTLLGGQYHERDTAHDIAFFGRDLEPGRTVEARVRTLLMPGTTSWGSVDAIDPPRLRELIDDEWQRWEGAL